MLSCGILRLDEEDVEALFAVFLDWALDFPLDLVLLGLANFGGAGIVGGALKDESKDS